MAIQKPRTRLINFRVSEDEYDQLRSASEKSGARSLSDFARSAILHSFDGDAHSIAPAISGIDKKVGDMQEQLGKLFIRLGLSEIAKAEHA